MRHRHKSKRDTAEQHAQQQSPVDQPVRDGLGSQPHGQAGLVARFTVDSGSLSAHAQARRIAELVGLPPQTELAAAAAPEFSRLDLVWLRRRRRKQREATIRSLSGDGDDDDII